VRESENHWVNQHYSYHIFTSYAFTLSCIDYKMSLKPTKTMLAMRHGLCQGIYYPTVRMLPHAGITLHIYITNKLIASANITLKCYIIVCHIITLDWAKENI